MRVRYHWRLHLPHGMKLGEGVDTRFSLEDGLQIELRPGAQVGVYDVLEISCPGHIADEFLSANDHPTAETQVLILHDLKDEALARIGRQLNAFYTSLCRSLNLRPFHPLYNGARLLVPYRSWATRTDVQRPGLLSSSAKGYPVLNQDKRLAVLANMSSFKDDIVSELLERARDFLASGHLEPAILNAHVALELSLSSLYQQNTDSPVETLLFQDLSNASMKKRFDMGIVLRNGTTLRSCEPDLFAHLHELYTLRNDVAHQGIAVSKGMRHAGTVEAWDRIDDLIDAVEDFVEGIIRY